MDLISTIYTQWSVITADVDGDGKGEFITGRYCVGTDGDGLGQLRWEMPIPLGWGIIADVDGDGKGGHIFT